MVLRQRACILHTLRLSSTVLCEVGTHGLAGVMGLKARSGSMPKWGSRGNAREFTTGGDELLDVLDVVLLLLVLLLLDHLVLAHRLHKGVIVACAPPGACSPALSAARCMRDVLAVAGHQGAAAQGRRSTQTGRCTAGDAHGRRGNPTRVVGEPLLGQPDHVRAHAVQEVLRT